MQPVAPVSSTHRAVAIEHENGRGLLATAFSTRSGCAVVTVSESERSTHSLYELRTHFTDFVGRTFTMPS